MYQITKDKLKSYWFILFISTVLAGFICTFIICWLSFFSGTWQVTVIFNEYNEHWIELFLLTISFLYLIYVLVKVRFFISYEQQQKIIDAARVIFE